MMIPLKYFGSSEFVMGDLNVAENMNSDFLLKLDMLRDLCGFPFRITSSFRTPEYNKRIGGSRNSMHLQGRAVDISCPDNARRALILRHALNMGLTVGIMPNSVHIDDRPKQIVFHYYPRYGESKSEHE